MTKIELLKKMLENEQNKQKELNQLAFNGSQFDELYQSLKRSLGISSNTIQSLILKLVDLEMQLNEYKKSEQEKINDLETKQMQDFLNQYKNV